MSSDWAPAVVFLSSRLPSICMCRFLDTGFQGLSTFRLLVSHLLSTNLLISLCAGLLGTEDFPFVSLLSPNTYLPTCLLLGGGPPPVVSHLSPYLSPCWEVMEDFGFPPLVSHVSLDLSACQGASGLGRWISGLSSLVSLLVVPRGSWD